MSGTDDHDAPSGFHYVAPWAYFAAAIGGGTLLGTGGTLTFAPQINQDGIAACYDISKEALTIATNANTVAADHGTEIERVRRNTDDTARRLDLQSDDLRRLKADLEIVARKVELHSLDAE